MAHITAGRVKETTTTTGTGAKTLAGAATNFRSFGSVLSNGDTCLIAIVHQSAAEWEIALATYSTTGPTLTSTVVLESSNSNNAVNFSAGTKDIFLDQSAESVALLNSRTISPAQITADQNDYAPTDHARAAILRINSNAQRTITGLAGGTAGRLLFLYNIGTFNIVLSNENASSTAANRFAGPGDITVPPGMMITLRYDGTSSRWRTDQNSSQTITQLTSYTSPASTDEVPVWDVANSLTKKATVADLVRGGNVVYEGFDYGPGAEFIIGQAGQASYFVQPMGFTPAFALSMVQIPVHNSNSSNSSGSHTLSFWIGLYTRNASTLSLAHSTSFTTALTHSGTAGSYSLFSGLRMLQFGWTTTISASNYWLGFASRTTSGGANGSYSHGIFSNVNSNLSGVFGAANNATKQFRLGLGFFSATTSGNPSNIPFSQINGSGSANLRPPVVQFAAISV